MLNFEPNYWYVYIIRNTKTDWLYIGLHHQSSNKQYTHSSSSVMLQEAIDSGYTKDYVVWKGKNAEKAAALETYLINLAKQNMYNVYNNNSGGGHKGGARPNILTPEDYNIGENIIVHKIYPKSISADNEREINDRLWMVSNKVKDAVKDRFDGKENPYKIVYEPIDKIISLPFLQIRENAIDVKNVEKVIESMLIDLKKAEYLVEPVSIVEFENGNLIRVDGTSTTYAAKELNVWSTLPVVYLPSSIFENNETYMKVYATLRNRPEKHKGANDPKKELKSHIRSFHLSNPDLFNESVEEFQNKFMILFNRSYSDRAMLANLNNYVKNIKKQNSLGDNWLDYSVNKGVLIEQLKSKITVLFPRSVCTHVIINSLENQGVGNPMNYFGNTGVSGKDTSVILTNHSSADTENKEEYYFDRYKNSLAEAGFFPDKEKAIKGYVPFVSKVTGKKIFVIFLPCRYDTTQFGEISNNIMRYLFEEENSIAA
jgi:predicted GIY-YIG superfamily endonuclease